MTVQPDWRFLGLTVMLGGGVIFAIVKHYPLLDTFCMVPGFAAMLLSLAMMDTPLRQPPLPGIVLIPIFLVSGVVFSLPLTLLLAAARAMQAEGFFASVVTWTAALVFFASSLGLFCFTLRLVGPATKRT
jgi:hypothetical protein